MLTTDLNSLVLAGGCIIGATTAGVLLRLVFQALARRAASTKRDWDDLGWGLLKNIALPSGVVSGLWGNAVEMGKIAGANMAGGKMRYPGGLEVMNAAEIEGIPLVSVGHVLPEENSGYESHRQQGAQRYRKLVFKDDVLAGAIFVGEIEGSGVYTAMIKAGKHLGVLKEKAVQGTISFADFFIACRS